MGSSAHQVGVQDHQVAEEHKRCRHSNPSQHEHLFQQKSKQPRAMKGLVRLAAQKRNQPASMLPWCQLSLPECLHKCRGQAQARGRDGKCRGRWVTCRNWQVEDLRTTSHMPSVQMSFPASCETRQADALCPASNAPHPGSGEKDKQQALSNFRERQAMQGRGTAARIYQHDVGLGQFPCRRN